MKQGWLFHRTWQALRVPSSSPTQICSGKTGIKSPMMGASSHRSEHSWLVKTGMFNSWRVGLEPTASPPDKVDQKVVIPANRPNYILGQIFQACIPRRPHPVIQQLSSPAKSELPEAMPTPAMLGLLRSAGDASLNMAMSWGRPGLIVEKSGCYG